MKKYLITYDLIKPEISPEYSRLVDVIKSYGIWAKPMKNIWIIKSYENSYEILNKLRLATDLNDKLMVVEITSDWTTFNVSKNVNDWLMS